MTVLRRRPGIASVATLGVITLTLGAARILAPEWSQHAGLDVWSYPGLQAELQATADDRTKLNAQHEQLWHQVEATDHIVGLLIGGEMSLPAAVDEIDQITHGRTGFLEALRFKHPDAVTDQQLLARYTIRKADEQLARDPDRRTRVIARLEAEYRQLPATP
jgi:hypothetical protein